MSISKMTFSLASLILIFALVAMPAMAATLSAEWTADLPGDDGAGWLVTVTFPATPAPTEPSATTLISGSITTAGVFAAITETTVTPTTPDPTGKKQWTFHVPTAANNTILVQVPGYQRVIFPVAASGASLSETTLVLLAKVMSVSGSTVTGQPNPITYIKANTVKDIVFTFAAASNTIGAPQNLHLSDVVEGQNQAEVFSPASVSGKNTVRVQASDNAANGNTTTYTLSSRIVQTGAKVATVMYDGSAPSYPTGDNVPDSDGATTIPVDRRKPQAPDQWGAVPFDYIFTIVEAHSGIQSVTLKDNQNFLSFSNVNPTGDVTNVANGIVYGATVSTQNKDITAGTVTTIFATVTDKAGNEAELNIGSVTLAAKSESAAPDATFTSATPASGNIGQSGEITLRFGTDPGDITVTSVPTGIGDSAITGSGETRTLTIPEDQQTVSVKITLSWGTSGTQVLNYTVTEAVPVYTVTVPPMSYLIVAHEDDPPGLNDNIVFPTNVSGVTGSKNPEVKAWAGMPNLENFFKYQGGTIALTIKEAAAGALFDHDADSTTDGRQYKAYDLIITEVMAATNEAKLGLAAADDHQWIEIFNPNKNAITAVLEAQRGRPALEAATGEVLLDRLSNVVGAGWPFADLGANGSDDLDPDTADTKKPFVSFYRKHDKYGASGADKGHWVTSTNLYTANYQGTPGAKERSTFAAIGTDTVPNSPLIFNEISNNTNANHEWIEIKNVSDKEQNLKDYEVTMLTTKGADQTSHNDVDLIDFTDADRKVPAGGILLVVKTDPTGNDDHPLAAGWNFGARNTWTVAKSGEANYVPGVNADSPRYMVAKSFGELPDNGNFVLVLRNRQDRNGSTADANIRDIAGYVPDNGLKVEEGAAFTHLWPLSNFAAPNITWNQLSSGAVHYRQHANIDGTANSHGDNKIEHGAFRDVDWTGIGYKRNARPIAQNGGTPGYAKNVLRSNDADANSAVIISEIMPTKGDRNLPEWIELRNLSSTIGVNVDNWRLTITNHDSDGAEGNYDGELTHTITLSGRIPPLQTYLIVARNGRNGTNLPNGRIKNAGRTRTQHLLNPHGFELKLESKKDDKYLGVDTVGNLGEAEGRRSRSFAKVSWDLPASMSESGDRVSIVRVGELGGTSKKAWRSFEGSAQAEQINRETYYGHESDYGSPGHYAGGVLPVSLSKFRPERLDDGSIVIRWITESELNNAGFNILRSEKRDGQFTKINTSLIAGQGTTSERTTYSMVDKSAKPNVVYYYQIQDVSLDGQVQTLRQSRLKGDVSPAGKLTTIWGEIKALQ